MSAGTCSEDMLWIVMEPDLCIRKIDAKSRMELLLARLGDENSKTYEDFAATIEDESKRTRFLVALTEWRRQQKEQGTYVPWLAAPSTTPKYGASSSSSSWTPRAANAVPSGPLPKKT